MFHPVTTEVENIEQYANSFVDALEQSGLNYVVIFPNNDMGSSDIFRAYERIENNPKSSVCFHRSVSSRS